MCFDIDFSVFTPLWGVFFKKPLPRSRGGGLGVYNVGALRNRTMIEVKKGILCTPLLVYNEIELVSPVPILLFLFF